MSKKYKKDYKHLYDSLIYMLNSFLKKYDFKDFDEIYDFMDKYKINNKIDNDVAVCSHNKNEVNSNIEKEKKVKQQTLSELDKIIIYYYKNNGIKNDMLLFPKMVNNIQINDNSKNIYLML